MVMGHEMSEMSYIKAYDEVWPQVSTHRLVVYLGYRLLKKYISLKKILSRSEFPLLITLIICIFAIQRFLTNLHNMSLPCNSQGHL